MSYEILNNLIKVLILDISGLYTQVYDELWVDIKTIEDLKKQYGNTKLWRVIVLD